MNEPKKDAPLVFTITDNKGVTYVVHNAEYCGPGYAEGKAEGIVLGEKRMARLLEKFLKKNFTSLFVDEWKVEVERTRKRGKK